MAGRREARVGAVVLHYRYWPGIRPTLEALAAQDHPIERIVVVDNCSADGSVEHLAEEPGIELLRADRNDGYAAGMNLGIAALLRDPLDAVLLLTHEATLSARGLTSLVDALVEDAGLGAVGPLLVWGEDHDLVYSAGVVFPPRSWSTHHVGAHDPVAAWADKGPQPADSLDGAAVLVRREALEATGPMDEEFFLYFEEADWFVRMRRHGFRVACVPAAQAVQQPGTPPPALWVRNSLRFLARNAPRRVLARELARTAFHAAGDVAHGRRRAARDRVAGLAAFALGRPARSLVAPS